MKVKDQDIDFVDPNSVDGDATIVAKAWGWESPPEAIIKLAENSVSSKSKLSGELLISMGVITPERLKELLQTKPDGTQIISWILENEPGVAPYVDRILATKMGFPFYDSLTYMVPHPCMEEKSVITVAEEMTAVVMMIEDVRPVIVFASFNSLVKYQSLGRSEKINDPITIHTAGSKLLLAVGALDEVHAVRLQYQTNGKNEGYAADGNIWSAHTSENKKPENRFVTRLFDNAIIKNATDISFKPFRSGEFQVQMRKDGSLIKPSLVDSIVTRELAMAVLSLLERRSGADTKHTIERTPTDGHIMYRSSAGEADMRLSFMPLNHRGHNKVLKSISIRVFIREETSVSLESLNLDKTVIDSVTYAMRGAQGLILVVGPTGSGKSSLLNGALDVHVKMFEDAVKRLSLEDPIERYLFGITQFQLPPVALVPDEFKRFEMMLRAIKRHDPDYIMLTEIRDGQTANFAVDSANTGHLVGTTYHANDTVMGFDGLSNTIEAHKRLQFVESLSLIISQRLVKRLCPHCCSEFNSPTQEMIDHYAKYCEYNGIDQTLTKYKLPSMVKNCNPDGCDKCNHGFEGKLPITEVLPFTRKVKNAAIDYIYGNYKAREIIVEERVSTLLESGLVRLAKGEITLDSILL